MGKVIAFMIGLSMCATTAAFAVDASFSWVPNQESDLAGYRIYWDSTAPVDGQWSPSNTVDVGLPDIADGRVPYTINDVPDTKIYYAATAYDSNNNESDYSNIVEYDPAPAAPSDVVSVTVNVTVSIK